MAAPAARRTQEERRAATRQRLLDATVECLVEDGYAGATIARITARAGYTRGAQLHHFRTRAQLVVEAVQHLADRRREELLARAASLPRGRARSGAAVDLLWEGFSGPLFVASLELWVAARTDPDLREALLPVERQTGAWIRSFLRELFDLTEAGRELDDVLALATNAMRGMALQAMLSADSASRARQLGLGKRMLLEYLSRPGARR